LNGRRERCEDLAIVKEEVAVPIDAVTRTELIDLMARIRY